MLGVGLPAKYSHAHGSPARHRKPRRASCEQPAGCPTPVPHSRAHCAHGVGAPGQAALISLMRPFKQGHLVLEHVRGALARGGVDKHAAAVAAAAHVVAARRGAQAAARAAQPAAGHLRAPALPGPSSGRLGSAAGATGRGERRPAGQAQAAGPAALPHIGPRQPQAACEPRSPRLGS